MDSSRVVTSTLAAFLLLALCLPLLAAESVAKHSLKSRHQIGEQTRVQVSLQVGGDLKLVNDGKATSLPMSVVARLKYDELLRGLDKQGQPSRSVRYYDDAQAVIKVDKGGQRPALEADHRLIMADKSPQTSPLLYCPSSALSREELDLIDVPGGSLLVDELLPNEPVAFGDSWKLDDQVLANLLCLDAVSWSEVTSTLGEIKDGKAEIAAAGSLNGAVGGIATEIELKAKYRFDLVHHRVTFLAMLIKEKRAVGHVGPGLDTVAKLLMSITPIRASKFLTREVIAKLPEEPAPEASELGYSAVSGQFRFQYDRRWFLTSDDEKLTILRLLDRGELVAQCNITLLPGTKKSPTTLAEFQKDVQASLGKSFGQFVHATQSNSQSGYLVYRVVARGEVSQLPIEWIYYLIQELNGRRVTLAFTYEQQLAERFANADRALVRQLRITKLPTPTASKPVTQQ